MSLTPWLALGGRTQLNHVHSTSRRFHAILTHLQPAVYMGAYGSLNRGYISLCMFMYVCREPNGDAPVLRGGGVEAALTRLDGGSASDRRLTLQHGSAPEGA